MNELRICPSGFSVLNDASVESSPLSSSCVSSSAGPQPRCAGVGRSPRGELGRGAGSQQGGPHGVGEEMVHRGLRGEANFGLGGMTIPTNSTRRHLEKQKHHRKNRRGDYVAVSFGQRVLN